MDWELVEIYFHRCVDLSVAERGIALLGLPADLRAAVEDLLAAGLISQPAGRVGNYRLVRQVGEGGMWAVFLAVRADDSYEKKVAVKFVRSSMDSPDLRLRFEAERRILAKLEHPNIARLLDAGSTQDGQPYLVMEYVRGENILTYAERQALTVRERIEIFVMVCSAVQHAHQNLIVHRDLKPGNILINKAGMPKLLDFGIAKLVEAEGSGGTTQVRILTPEYASPEQVRGQAVSTASDVYSLGAVLQALVAGETAGRDLEIILMKAMRQEARHRYRSAADLADDLRRYLDGRAILARDYSALERLWMAARHSGQWPVVGGQ